MLPRMAHLFQVMSCRPCELNFFIIVNAHVGDIGTAWDLLIKLKRIVALGKLPVQVAVYNNRSRSVF